MSLLDRRLAPFGLIVVAIAIGVAAAGVLPWPIALVTAAFGVAVPTVISWWGAGWLVPAIFQARPLTHVHPDIAEALTADVAGWARQVGIRPPRLCLLDSRVAGASAAGGGAGAAILVTSGLIENCSLSEIRALLAHEVGHLREGDTALLAASSVLSVAARLTAWALIGAGVLAPLMLISMIGLLSRPRRQLVAIRRMLRSAPSLVEALVHRTVMPLLAWACRDAELEADRVGAQLAGRAAMMTAVAQIDSLNRGLAADARLFDYHPAVDERIEALMALEPLPGEVA